MTFAGSKPTVSVIYSTYASPVAALLAVGNTFYGSTVGADYTCYDSCGTLFLLTPSGSKYVATDLHNFENETGGDPTAALIQFGGKLFGTASAGGSEYGGGVVYSIDKTGSDYTIIHTFEGGKDGANPYAPLLEFDGALYGTTVNGGANGDGVVYEIKQVSGAYKERVVYSFRGGSDGANPLGKLISLDDALYGTTSEGGGGTACDGNGCGSVFRLTPTKSGFSEKSLHVFQGIPDGGGLRS